MRVKNDFPNVDGVLRKLKEFSQYFQNQGKEDPLAETAMQTIEEFINAIQNYLDSVCNAQDRIAKARRTCNTEDLQYIIESEDSKRTLYHSEIISSMVFIDRLATAVGLKKVFDYAEEFQDSFDQLTPNTVEEKLRMPERARIKRREMGNFGLYIGASLTAGMDKKYMISDDEAREFAGCESDNVDVDTTVYDKVKDTSNKFKRNIAEVLE